MKIKVVVISLSLALMSFGSALAVQLDDEDVRGAFLTTRPKAAATKPTSSSKPSRRRPKPKVTTPSPAKSTSGGTTSSTVTPAEPKRVLPRLGMGLTLFSRDSNGLAVRTDPAHEFQNGDRVRVLLETNADGYLYIFNTTDNRKPIMIYPDPELDEAGNYITAHVPFEIPASTAAEERLRWFSFDQNAGTEKLYFVFSREPLANTPIEDDLISYCRDPSARCPWNPGADVWTIVEKEMAEPVKVDQAAKFGRAETKSEQEATSRGIGLNRDDPEPSLIMLTASTTKNMLVATLSLVHRSASQSGLEDEVTGEVFP